MGDMAAEAQETREQPPAEHTANDEAAQREAYDYWGYLLKTDKCGTPMLDRLLKGIAEVISKKFEPSDSPDLTPSQIAAWYRAVGGDYDMLFTETAPSSIAFIYRALGAFHSLQPSASDDGYSSPAIPALKKQGFVTWQTIQLLLGPQEHVPFLQKSVEQFDVIDPDTKQPFLKLLPSKCFPAKPDEAMEEWYEGVAARLRKEADAEANGVRTDNEPRSSADLSGDGSSADERTGAFKYFEDPMYRKARPRPTYMRHVSKEQARANNDGPIARVRHMLNPWARRRSLPPGRYEEDSLSDEDATPIAPNPNQRYPTHKRPHPPRRESSLSTADSDSDPDQPPSRRRTPVLRHHRSHEQPVSPREYFPSYHEPYRPSPQRLPSDAIYPRERHDRDRDRDRDRDVARTRSHDRVKDEWDDRDRDRSRDKRSYDRSREHSRDRDRERDRDRHRGSHRYVTGVEGGVSGRRYPVVSANPSY
ncbi:Tricalbin-2 [Didymella pomorum]